MVLPPGNKVRATYFLQETSLVTAINYSVKSYIFIWRSGFQKPAVWFLFLASPLLLRNSLSNYSNTYLAVFFVLVQVFIFQVMLPNTLDTNNQPPLRYLNNHTGLFVLSLIIPLWLWSVVVQKVICALEYKLSRFPFQIFLPSFSIICTAAVLKYGYYRESNLKIIWRDVASHKLQHYDSQLIERYKLITGADERVISLPALTMQPKSVFVIDLYEKGEKLPSTSFSRL